MEKGKIITGCIYKNDFYYAIKNKIFKLDSFSGKKKLIAKRDSYIASLCVSNGNLYDATSGDKFPRLEGTSYFDDNVYKLIFPATIRETITDKVITLEEEFTIFDMCSLDNRETPKNL